MSSFVCGQLESADWRLDLSNLRMSWTKYVSGLSRARRMQGPVSNFKVVGIIIWATMLQRWRMKRSRYVIGLLFSARELQKAVMAQVLLTHATWTETKSTARRAIKPEHSSDEEPVAAGSNETSLPGWELQGMG